MGELGEILSRTAMLARAGAGRVALALVLMVGPGFLIDSGATSEQGANGLILLTSVVNFFLQYWLTRALLADLGFEVPQRSRLLAFLGVSMVTGFGISLGLLLLVIPGLVLIARWSIALPLLLSSDAGVFASIEQSWRQTRGYVWPIIASFLIIYVPGLALYFGGVWLVSTSGLSYPGILAMNFVLSASLIAAWHASVAIFTLLNSSPRMAEIFE